MAKSFIHPYIPNSISKIKEEMMRSIGIQSIEELYADVPQRFKLKRRLDLPSPTSEQEVKRLVETILSKNKTFQDMPIFLGAGCWSHYVPAAVETAIQQQNSSHPTLHINRRFPKECCKHFLSIKA